MNVRRVVAYGLRQPFRFTQRPGTEELWIGEVGWDTFEEIDRDLVPGHRAQLRLAVLRGPGRQPAYDAADLSICEDLYAESGAVTDAVLHVPSRRPRGRPADELPARAPRRSAGSLSTRRPAPIPTSYDGALFFADYSRECIWVMPAGSDGLPDPRADVVVRRTGCPVDLTVGPRRRAVLSPTSAPGRSSASATSPRTPSATATSPTSRERAAGGQLRRAPGSTDWTGSADTLTYAWDLDGDGDYDDSASAYPDPYLRGRARRSCACASPTTSGESDVSDPIAIHAGNTPPTATIDTPASSLRWAAGDTVTFAGSATDPQDGTLGRREHALGPEHSGIARATVTRISCAAGTERSSDSFSAPDHEYPVTRRADADRHRLRGPERLEDGLTGTRHGGS